MQFIIADIFQSVRKVRSPTTLTHSSSHPTVPFRIFHCGPETLSILPSLPSVTAATLLSHTLPSTCTEAWSRLSLEEQRGWTPEAFSPLGELSCVQKEASSLPDLRTPEPLGNDCNSTQKHPPGTTQVMTTDKKFLGFLPSMDEAHS